MRIVANLPIFGRKLSKITSALVIAGAVTSSGLWAQAIVDPSTYNPDDWIHLYPERLWERYTVAPLNEDSDRLNELEADRPIASEAGYGSSSSI